MSSRKRGRPGKSDEEGPKKGAFVLKKPKYLEKLEKDETVELFLNSSRQKSSANEERNSRSRPSRTSNRRKRLTLSSSKRKRPKVSSTPKLKSISSSAYYQQFRSYKSSSYDYSDQESDEADGDADGYGEGERSDDDSSSFYEAENTSLMDNLSDDLESNLSENDESENEDAVSTCSKKSARSTQESSSDLQPIWLQNRTDVPKLMLPISSNDLLIERQLVLDVVSIYEILRVFSTQIRLTPFRFEDFCACLVSDEQSPLLVEVHMSLLKALIREDESQQTLFALPDHKDSVNIAIFLIDPMTWPEVLRCYIESDTRFDRSVLRILNNGDYPFVPVAQRLEILRFLTDQILMTVIARDDSNQQLESSHQPEDYCRVCHKLGNLLCCDSCTASFHFDCIEPPIDEVPESDWTCDLCKLHEIEGVSNSKTENETIRISPLGYDRHGRKYFFIVRRLIVECSKDNQVWYYSTEEQLKQVLRCLDANEFEKKLVSAIQEQIIEITNQMKSTLTLTDSSKGSRVSYLDSLTEIINGIENEEKSKMDMADVSRKFDEINNSKLLFKLGIEGGYKQYVNQYSVNPVALNKQQKNEERDRKRYLSHKFSLTPASDFKWSGPCNGPKSVLISTLRNTLLYFENSIPMIFMHVNWKYVRTTWLMGASSSQETIDFSRILLLLESCMKQVLFANVWNDQNGHLAMRRLTLTERDELKKLEKRLKREKDEDEQRNRLAVNYVKYPINLRHQVWKQRGEEYRVHGQWGWQWKSISYRLKSKFSNVKRLTLANKIKQKLIFLECDDDAKKKMFFLHPELHDYFVNFKSSLPDQIQSTDVKPKTEEKEEMETEMETETEKSQELHQVTKIEEVDENKTGDAESQIVNDELNGVTSDPNQMSLDESNRPTDSDPNPNTDPDPDPDPDHSINTDTFLTKFKNCKILPIPSEFETINVSLSLSFNRVPYPKTVTGTIIDDLLRRRNQFTLFDEMKIMKLPESNYLMTTGNGESAEMRGPFKEELLAAITKRIQVLKARYSFVARSLSRYKCYSYDCTADRNTVLLVSQSCYSPICMLRTRLRKDLLTLLKEINYQASTNAPKLAGAALSYSKRIALLEQRLRERILSEQTAPTTVEDIQQLISSIYDKSPFHNEDIQQSAFTLRKVTAALKTESDEHLTSVKTEAVNEIKMETSTEERRGEKQKEKDGKKETTKTPGKKRTNSNKESMSTTTPKPLRNVEGVVQSMEPLTKPAIIESGSRINRRFNSEPKHIRDDNKSNSHAESTSKKNGESAKKKANGNQTETNKNADKNMDSKSQNALSTRRKVYLKRIEIENRVGQSTGPPLKIPVPSRFKNKNGTYSVFVLPRHHLLKLARKGGLVTVPGYNTMVKTVRLNWPYPCSKPLFKTCWLYRTVTMKSIAAACLQLRILWSCIRWDDLETKPPADGKNQITTDNEIITYELLKHRTLGSFMNRTQYLRRKQIVPLEAPTTPRSTTARELTTIRLGLRKRKRPESPQITEPQVIEEWIDEEKIDLWELRLYADKISERAITNQVLTRSRTGNLPVSRQLVESPFIDKNRTVLSRILSAPVQNATSNNSSQIVSIVVNHQHQKFLNSSAGGGVGQTSEEIRQKLENDLRIQREAAQNRRNSELLQTTSGQLIKILPSSQTQGHPTTNDTRLKIINRIKLNSENQTLQSLLQSDSNKVVAPGSQIIVKNANGTTKLYQTVNSSPGLNQSNSFKIPTQNIIPQHLVQKLPKYRVIRNSMNGQIEILGLAPNQQFVQQPDGTIHIITNNRVVESPVTSAAAAAAASQAASNKQLTLAKSQMPTLVSSLSNATKTVPISMKQLQALESSNLNGEMNGTIVRNITVQVVKTQDGAYGIMTKGLSYSEYTEKQLIDIQQQIKDKLQDTQKILGTPLIKDPIEMKIVIKPDYTNRKVRIVKQSTTTSNSPAAIVTSSSIEQSSISNAKSATNNSSLNTQSIAANNAVENVLENMQTSEPHSTTGIVVRRNAVSANSLLEKEKLSINVKEKLKETVHQKLLEERRLSLPALAAAAAAASAVSVPSSVSMPTLTPQSPSSASSPIPPSRNATTTAASPPQLKTSAVASLPVAAVASNAATPATTASVAAASMSLASSASSSHLLSSHDDNNALNDTTGGSSSSNSNSQLSTAKKSSLFFGEKRSARKRYNSFKDDVDYVPGATPSKRKYVRKKFNLNSKFESDEEEMERESPVDDSEKSRGNSKRKSDSESETATVLQSNSLSKPNLSSNVSLTERNNNDSLANDRSRKSSSAVPKSSSGSSKKESKKSTGSSVAAAASSSSGSASRRGRKPLSNRKERVREASVEGDFSCYCHAPYDDTKFYVGCDVCYKWFHGECINIDEKKSKTLDQFVCEDCQDNASSDNKLYCLCREPYDDKQFYICCDKCQDWFHGRCVGVLQSEAKKIDVYICPNCENDSTFLKVNQKVLTNEDYDDLTKLLKQLQGNKNSWPFLIPVDSDDVPDYYDVIKSPMDLRTLESKLKERSYTTLSNFVTDAVKIFDNCRYFNPKESEFYKCADLFEAVFVNKLKIVRDAILERL